MADGAAVEAAADHVAADPGPIDVWVNAAFLEVVRGLGRDGVNRGARMPAQVDEAPPALQAAAPVGRADDVEALAAAQPWPQRDVAGHGGELAVQPGGVVPRVGVEQPDVAAIGADQAEQDADGVGLAGAVGTEEAVDLAGADGGRGRRVRGSCRTT